MTKTNDMFDDKSAKRDDNRDPLSGAPGAHPVGAGLGAVGAGAAAGAAAGAIAGPAGAVIGAAAGGVAGGLAGKAVAEMVNPTAEDAYWRESFTKRPYAESGARYDDYGPAYRYGWESYAERGRKAGSFDSLEPDLRRDWDTRRGASRLNWDRAKEAARDAWNRVERAIPGDSDRDGN